jgi:hypothetical protein
MERADLPHSAFMPASSQGYETSGAGSREAWAMDTVPIKLNSPIHRKAGATDAIPPQLGRTSPTAP